MDTGEIILLVVVGLLLLALAWFVVLWIIRGTTALSLGAVVLFGFAGEQGFIGIASYFAVWVFLTPIMLVVCIIVGIVARRELAEQEFAETWQERARQDDYRLEQSRRELWGEDDVEQSE